MARSRGQAFLSVTRDAKSTMKIREVIRMLEDDGWEQVVQKGSHRQFKHPIKKGRDTVAGRRSCRPPPPTRTCTGRSMA
jgi:predicted RNA binding protein YcfA (HicA-like mRNA interferase family)